VACQLGASCSACCLLAGGGNDSSSHGRL
jgi:hypothetical protein